MVMVPDGGTAFAVVKVMMCVVEVDGCEFAIKSDIGDRRPASAVPAKKSTKHTIKKYEKRSILDIEDATESCGFAGERRRHGDIDRVLSGIGLTIPVSTAQHAPHT